MRGLTDPPRSPSWRLIALGGVILALALAGVETRRIARPPLPSVAELADARPEVRIEALRRVAAAWPAGARLAPLLPDILVADPDPAVRRVAREALEALCAPALTWYVRLLADAQLDRLPHVALVTAEFERLGYAVTLEGLLLGLEDVHPALPDIALLGLPAHTRPRPGEGGGSDSLWLELALLERLSVAAPGEHEGLAAGLVLVASGEARRRAPHPFPTRTDHPETARLLSMLRPSTRGPWLEYAVAGVLGSLAPPTETYVRESRAGVVLGLDPYAIEVLHAAWQITDPGQAPPTVPAAITEALRTGLLPGIEPQKQKEFAGYCEALATLARRSPSSAAPARTTLLALLRLAAAATDEGQHRDWSKSALDALAYMPRLSTHEAAALEVLAPGLAPGDERLLTLTLLLLGESGSTEHVRDVWAALETATRTALGSSIYGWGIERRARAALRARADLVFEAGLLDSRPSESPVGRSLTLLGLQGLAGLPPGPTRDRVMESMATGHVHSGLPWPNACDALNRHEFRMAYRYSHGQIMHALQAAHAVLDALMAWGTPSLSLENVMRHVREAPDPRLAWRAHWAYRAMGGR